MVSETFSQALVLLRSMHKQFKMTMTQLNCLLMSVQFSSATNGKFSPGVDSWITVLAKWRTLIPFVSD